MLETILFYVAAGVLITLLLWYINLWYCSRGISHIPGPTSIPLIGNGLDFINSTVVLDSMQKFERKYKTRTIKYAIGTEVFLVTTDYKFIEYTHNKVLEKSPVYLLLNPWLGTGLLTSGGEKWKKHRRMLTPTFHFSILEQYINIFCSASEVLIQQLRKEALDGPSFDIYKYINLCAMDVICESAMGVKVNAQTQDSAYVRAVKAECQVIVNRVLSAVLKYPWYYWATQDCRVEKKALKVIHNHTNSIIQKRRREILELGTAAGLSTPMVNGDKSGDTYSDRKKMFFMDLLLQSSIEGHGLTDEEIREEVDTFMFEGHDTVTSAISFAVHCLANHAEVQERVLAEQRQIFGEDRHRRATHKDLQDMRYLELVVKEALRLYPSVPFYMRLIDETCEFDGMTLHKGLTIVLFLFGLHRNPDYFPDPLKFDPDRFNSDNNLGKFPYSYVPFSAGPRNCIGQRFAMLELKSTLSKLIREFELVSVGHEPVLGVEVILKPINGIRLKIKNRIW